MAAGAASDQDEEVEEFFGKLRVSNRHVRQETRPVRHENRPVSLQNLKTISE